MRSFQPSVKANGPHQTRGWTVLGGMTDHHRRLIDADPVVSLSQNPRIEFVANDVVAPGCFRHRWPPIGNNEFSWRRWSASGHGLTRQTTGPGFGQAHRNSRYHLVEKAGDHHRLPAIQSPPGFLNHLIRRLIEKLGISSAVKSGPLRKPSPGRSGTDGKHGYPDRSEFVAQSKAPMQEKGLARRINGKGRNGLMCSNRGDIDHGSATLQKTRHKACHQLHRGQDIQSDHAEMQLHRSRSEGAIVAESSVVDNQHFTRPVDRVDALQHPIRRRFALNWNREITRSVNQMGRSKNRPRIRPRKVANHNPCAYLADRLYEGFPNSRGSPCQKDESYPFQSVLNCTHKAGTRLFFTITIKYDTDYE